MKKIILILIAVFGIHNGFAQQFPLQSQYQFNYSSINPAAVGEFDYLSIVASYRNQWLGFNTQNNQAIATQYVTFTKGFGTNGLGLTLLNDNTGGAFNTTGLRLSYSHKVIFETHDLFLGLSGGGTQINASPINDPVFVNNSDFVPEATFGAYILIKNWKFGFSVPGILNENIELTNSNKNEIKSHVYTMISYTKKVNDNWALYPSVLIKNNENHYQLDANLNIKVKNKVWFGASYRTSNSEYTQVKEAFGPSVYLGIDLGRLFSIYSHDISSGSLSSYPTHEITLGYHFITDAEVDQKSNEIKEKDEEPIVNDKDNDGIVDTLDLCPEEYGEAIANGCPDSDKDGIPDKYDLCPYLFGDLSLQGCPNLTIDESEIISMALEDLKFNVDEAIIKNESFGSLIELIVLMHKNPKMMLFIEGHASSEGPSLYNLNLSAQRAKSVQQFFIKRGIDKGRLIMDFHGEDAPLNTNSTELERAENRRVHFEIKYHLVDKLSANDLMEEYKSLLDSVYGKDTIIGPPKITEVSEENEEILEMTNDSIPAIGNDTLMIIEEVPATEGSENDNE